MFPYKSLAHFLTKFEAEKCRRIFLRLAAAKGFKRATFLVQSGLYMASGMAISLHLVVLVL